MHAGTTWVLIALTGGCVCLLPWFYETGGKSACDLYRWKCWPTTPATLLFLFPVGLMAVSLPLMLVVRFGQAFQAHHDNEHPKPIRLRGLFYLGLAGGVLLQSQLLAPNWGTGVGRLVFAVALAVLILAGIAVWQRHRSVPTNRKLISN